MATKSKRTPHRPVPPPLGRRDAVVALGVAVLVFAVDWSVLPRDVLNYRDSLEVVTASTNLEAAHPTGFPLSILLNHALGAALGFVVSPYFRLAIVHALYGNAALAIVYLCLRRWVFDFRVAALGTLLVGFGYGVWLYRVVPELFVLAQLGGLVSLWLLLRWRERRSEQAWRLFCFSLGIGLVLHVTTALWWPGFLALFALSRPRRLVRLAWTGLLSGLVGLTPFGLVFWLAKRAHHALWGNVPTWSAYQGYVLRTAYGGLQSPGHIAHVDPDRLGGLTAYLSHVGSELGLFTLAFALIALALRNEERYLAFLPATVVAAGPVFVAYAGFRTESTFYRGSAEPMYVTSIVAIVLSAVVGAERLVRVLSTRLSDERARRRLGHGFVALLGGLAVAQAWVNHPRVDRHHRPLSRAYIDDELREVPDHAILILSSDMDLFGGIYSAWVEDRPHDAIVVPAGFSYQANYQAELRREHPDLNVNEAGVRSVFLRRFIRENVDARPVFLSNPEEAFVIGCAGNPFYLRPAGKLFEVVSSKEEAAAKRTALPLPDALADDVEEHDMWELTLLGSYRTSWSQIGHELVRLGLLDRARAFFAKLHDVDPGDVRWGSEVAWIDGGSASRRYVYDGEVWGARNYEDLYQEALAAIGAQEHERALLLFEMALAKRPSDAKAANALAMIYLALHDARGAKPYAEAAATLDPTNDKYLRDREHIEREARRPE